MSFINWLKSLFKSSSPKTITRKVTQRVTAEGAPLPPPTKEDAPRPRNVDVTSQDAGWKYPFAWKYCADPDGGKNPLKTEDGRPAGIVIHHTVTYNLNGTVKYFQNNAVDVHFVVGHDGKVVQMVPCNRTAAHAGKSSWAGMESLNNYFIGIEVVNMGWLTREGEKYYDAYGKEWSGPVREREAFGYKYWEPFTKEQEQAVLNLCRWLCSSYKIPVENVRAHFEVSPGRKVDPAGGMEISFDEFRRLVSRQGRAP